AAPGAASPHLAPDGSGSGALLLSWLEPLTAADGSGAPGHRLRFARFADGHWSEPRTVATGTDFFANWADLPAVVRMGDGSLAAHWLAKTGAGTYDYGIRLARSADGGATWTPAGVLHDDGEDRGGRGEHGFVSWLPEGTGLRAFWLDGRETAAAVGLEGGHDSGHGGGHEDMGGAMTLRTARLEPTPGTATTIAVTEAARVDGRVCDCCQTDAAVTSLGPLVVYRDRSDGGEVRDIEARYRTAAGWSAPVAVGRDGWQIAGCPVNGPAVAADGNRVAVAWFTGADPGARVRIAFSGDGGASFGPPVEVDADAPLGRVDLVLSAASEAVVGWLARGTAADGANRAGLRLRRVAPDGRAGEPFTVAATGAARSSGFPRLARSGDRLVLAWVDDAAPSRLRAVALPLAALPAAR
ncbi:MAG TPA: hypothetical protein VEG34_19345, partial [Thermoanaerobaculia bacterium]|nr:hypothetical protein [Thermoanaerobaculia bacterium]